MSKLYSGSTRAAQRTSAAGFSSSSAPTFSGSRSLIQAMLPSWVIDEMGLHTFVLTAEKCGGEWYLSLHLKNKRDRISTCTRLPARDILINGKPLDHFLEVIAGMAG